MGVGRRGARCTPGRSPSAVACWEVSATSLVVKMKCRGSKDPPSAPLDRPGFFTWDRQGRGPGAQPSWEVQAGHSSSFYLHFHLALLHLKCHQNCAELKII